MISGHVDSGQSITIGRLVFELGGIPERELEKLKAEAERLGKFSFAPAFYIAGLMYAEDNDSYRSASTPAGESSTNCTAVTVAAVIVAAVTPAMWVSECLLFTRHQWGLHIKIACFIIFFSRVHPSLLEGAQVCERCSKRKRNYEKEGKK